jgi:predicted solute-binding protein
MNHKVAAADVVAPKPAPGVLLHDSQPADHKGTHTALTVNTATSYALMQLTSPLSLSLGLSHSHLMLEYWPSVAVWITLMLLVDT